MEALARSYGNVEEVLGFKQCWSRGMVEGGAGEVLGTVRLEQRGTWRLGHHVAVSTSTMVSMSMAVRGARRGLR